jgi:NADH dehydrogenase
VRGYDNVTFLRARALDIDTARRTVAATEGDLPYDYLIVAAGAVTNFFGNPGLEERAYALKTLDEALGLRNHILEVFERAALSDDEAERRRLMSIVIVGAGPTGVELASGIAELIAQVLRRDVPSLDVSEAQVTVVGMSSEVLETFAPGLRNAAHRG